MQTRTKLVPFYPYAWIYGRNSIQKISIRKIQGRFTLEFRLTSKELGEISISDLHGQKSGAIKTILGEFLKANNASPTFSSYKLKG